MINDLEDLKHALAVLETHGGDTNAIEAKTFSEYSPQQLGPTLSAFANMPDGGVILLGVSERNGIDVVGIDNADSLLKKRLTKPETASVCQSRLMLDRSTWMARRSG